MSIASELQDLNTNLTNAKTAVKNKGGTISNTGLAGLADEIATISGGDIVNAIIETYKAYSKTLSPNTFIQILTKTIEHHKTIEVDDTITLSSNISNNSDYDIVALDAERFFIAYKTSNNTLGCRVLKIVENEFIVGDEVVISSYPNQINAIYSSDNCVVIIHEGQHIYYLNACVCTVNNITITAGSDEKFTVSNYRNEAVKFVCEKNEDNFILNSHLNSNATSGWMSYELTIDPTTRTLNTKIQGGAASGFGIIGNKQTRSVKPNGCLLGVYTTAESGTNTSYAIRAIDKKTTTNYYATATGSTEYGLYSLDCAPVDNNNFAVVFNNSDFQLKLVGYYQVGATLSNNFGGVSSGLAVDTTCNISLCYIEDGKLLCSYRDKDTGDMVGVYITISGTTVTWGEPFTLNGASGDNKLIGLNGAYLSSVINNGLNLSANGEITTYEYVDCVEEADDNIDGVTKTECTVDNAGQVYILDPFSQYTKYDYITSDGTAYINTEVQGKDTISVESSFSTAQNISGNFYIVSAKGTSPNVNCLTMWVNSGSWFTTGWGNQQGLVSTLTFHDKYWSETNGEYTGPHIWTYSGGILSIDGTQFDDKSSATWAGGTYDNIHTFCRYSAGTVDRIADQYCKLYYLKLWDGDTLVRDFVPCTNPQGIAGLYDKVSQTFYGPANGGAFTAGND